MLRRAALLAALLAAAGVAAAEPPARPPARPLDLSLRIPSGAPPPAAVAEAERLDRGFTLNAPVLERYGFSLEQYQKLGASEQSRVFEWVRILERERLLEEARGASGSARAPSSPLSGAGWTSEKQAALERLRASAAAPGRVFDGARAGGGAGGKAYFTPDVELFGTPFLLPDGTQGPGALRRFSLVSPSGLKLEYGNLGVDGRSPLVEESPYLSVSKEGASGSGKVDYEYKWRLNAVDLGARLYPDDNPGLDRKIDAGIDSLKTLDPQWGVKQSDVDRLHEQLSFSHDFERQWLFAGSALGRVGRAWTLTPGLDVGCSAMGLVRVTGIFPNATTDQTCGTRFTVAPNNYVGLFGGVTEGLGLFDKTAIADSLADGSAALHVHPELAPHGEVVLWGKLPYLSSAEYTLAGGRQYNPWTTVTSLSGAVTAPVGDARVGAFGRYSDESGPDLEFERQKSAAGLSVTPKPGVDLWAQYMQDSARFGSAQIDSRGVMVGLTLSETQGPAQGSRITLESLFGGQESIVPVEKRSEFLDLLQQELKELEALKDAGLASVGGPAGAWSGVQRAYGRLPDDVKQLLGEAWKLADPGAPPLAQLVAIKPPDFNTLNKLVDLFGDVDVMERLLVRAVRHQILKEIAKTEIPILGQKVRLSAPLILAAANAYSLSLTPLPPITQKDARNALDPWLLGKISGAAGCASGPQPQATTDCILKGLPADAQKTIKDQFGGDLNALLKAAVSWPSDVLRREMDQAALQVILAAETLNDLSVDGGERIADLNVRGMIDSFAYLDARTKSDGRAILRAAASQLRGDLAAVDSEMGAQLEQYGSARLAWLQSQSAWPSNVKILVRPEDWSALLAVYGDAKLFDLILRAKGALALSHPSSPARLLITLDRSGNPLNAVTLVRGDPAELRLPARARDLSSVDLSF